jgi:hypothetical protein
VYPYVILLNLVAPSLVLDDGDNRCLVTRQDDPQFSSFVYWVVASTVYAEERGITQATADRMPKTVNLFGDDFREMLIVAIKSVGSYYEILDRNIGKEFRSGRNAINPVTARGSQFYVPPGFGPDLF